MKPEIRLGRPAEANDERDAVHVAVIPLIHDVMVYPGQHLGYGDGRLSQTDPCGVVDPFLSHPVPPGQRFWFLLYPGTIQSIRHDWFHPAFEAVGSNPKAESKAWIAAFAARFGMSYDDFIADATNMVERGDYVYRGSDESYKDVADSDEWEQFWEHYGVLMDKTVDEKWSFFSCAC